MASSIERTAKSKTSNASVSNERSGDGSTPFVPRTDFGRELMAIRAKIVASGQPLLTWDELEREIAERRGGMVDDDR